MQISELSGRGRARRMRGAVAAVAVLVVGALLGWAAAAVFAPPRGVIDASAFTMVEPAHQVDAALPVGAHAAPARVVMLRRKDFGRRRALGAGRRLIIALLMTQVGLLAMLGATAGSAVALIVLAATGDPSPEPGYVAGVAVLAVAVGLIAGALPVLAAARREPIVELRVS